MRTDIEEQGNRQERELSRADLSEIDIASKNLG